MPVAASPVQSPPVDPESLRYTTYRISLASGILGSVGATLAWLFWLTARLGIGRTIGTVLIGAGLGLAVEWTRHYVHVARREREGESLRPVAGGSRGLRQLAWASGMGFIGLVAEHLVAHMAGEFLVPFLASLITLLPAGVIIGWTMSRGAEHDENLIMMIANGLLIGAAIAMVTGILWLVSFGTAPWFALFSWWGLIGIGTRMVARPGRHAMSVEDPAVAVVVIFVLALLINLLPMTQSSYRKLGPFSNLALQVRAMAADIKESPAVPEAFWKEAEIEFEAKTGAGAEAAKVAAKPPRYVLDTSPTRRYVDLKGAVNRLVGDDSTANATVNGKPWDQATWAEFLRSWAVILFFAIGVGYAPRVERLLRPVDYPNSETYRRDIFLTFVVLLVVLGSCLYARSDRGNHPGITAASMPQ